MKQVHTKKRNRLEKKRLNDLIFIQYNQRLNECYLEWFQIEDPILVKDSDPTSEWLVEPDVRGELVFEGESLTWTQVQELLDPKHKKGKEVAQKKGKGKGKKKVQTKRWTTILEEEEDADSEETGEEGFYVEKEDDSDDDGLASLSDSGGQHDGRRPQVASNDETQPHNLVHHIWGLKKTFCGLWPLIVGCDFF
ncbi:hypothetical protein AMTRI_Chr01g132980 [Amborella trichopoda]